MWLIIIPSLLAGLGLPLYAIWLGLGWTTAQLVVAGLMAFDLTGGVVTNATSTAKRWYHRPGQSWVQHIGLSPSKPCTSDWSRGCSVAWIGSNSWSSMSTCWRRGCSSPGRSCISKRSVALLLLFGALILNAYILTPTLGLEWFVLVFFLKLLVSHLVMEAPYPAEAR